MQRHHYLLSHFFKTLYLISQKLVRLAFRRMSNTMSAYDFSKEAKRSVLSSEVYKFIFDYHGFAFFTGLHLGYEWLSVEQNHSGVELVGSESGFKLGITFGWDIRPNRIQSWYLRTNLRYTPNLNVNMPTGGNVIIDQLEFNLIQLVIFPGRMF
jgi:hypothetical protein